ESPEVQQRPAAGDLHAFAPRTGPLEQLHHLQEEVTRQQHWIKRRRDLKEHDHQFKRQHAACVRAIERGEQQRRALWARCGVATPEQFYELVDRKASLVEMRSQHQELDQQIRSMIGSNLDYHEVAAALADTSQEQLEQRWESLTSRTAETQERVATLQTQLGESAADMKHLAEDRRLMYAGLELGCVNRKIQAIAERWQILATASHLVEEVCGKFERERQPETLREASSFLAQLTDGKYNRIWTPLGTNQLKIDHASGKALPLEVLSRGTREAVFIALRLSLAAAYARRGVMLPLILDDVLVNFDGDRAMHAAETLRTFAELGHQVMMFTCHEHIVEIFHSIGVEVRQLPNQGEPGRATILMPEAEYEDETTEYEDEPVAYEPEPAELSADEPEPEPTIEPESEPIVIEKRPEPEAPKVIVIEKPAPPPKVKTVYVERPVKRPEPEVVETVIREDAPQRQSIGWAWFEREPADGKISEDERVAAEINAADRADSERDFPNDEPAEWIESFAESEAIPEEVLNRDHASWDGSRVAM
ncbi:MAG: hypothetical protein AAGJ83_13310, partial [Planctomycetota bacterium]